MQLNHTTVSGNVAGYEGGGITTTRTIDLVNSTVSHNLAGYGRRHRLEYLLTSKNTTIS